MITRITPLTLPYPPTLPEGIRPEEALFFDIETTGFAADVTALYLIGCVCQKDGEWTLIQWFADDNRSEASLLTSFFQLAQNYRCLLHYNGTSFDLPYLMKKCEKHAFDYRIPEEKSYDLYKKLQPFRSLLRLENLKQRTIEQYLGLSRPSPYSGGDLISYYGRYLKAKYGHLPEENTYLELLLSHNQEDLNGLLGITPMLALPAMLNECQAQGATRNLIRKELLIPLLLPLPVPKPFYYRLEQFSLSVSASQATLRISLCQQELKFFYSNYKDYYYLPEEDMAIHKSVAFYVDKHYRTKAKAANCYSKHTGCFVPQFEELIEPFFKIDYADRTTWLEATDEFCQDEKQLTRYAKHLLKHLI